jgi:hypothetical protein
VVLSHELRGGGLVPDEQVGGGLGSAVDGSPLAYAGKKRVERGICVCDGTDGWRRGEVLWLLDALVINGPQSLSDM